MKSMNRSNCIVIAFLVLALSSHLESRSQPFINDIRKFRSMDSLQAPPDRPILFIGSSSFTNWKDLPDWFPKHTVLNRAFGGSSLTHLIQYADDVVFRYNPRQIVVYCGENDLATDAKVNGDSVYQRFRRLYRMIRAKDRKVPVVYVSMKPSPSRVALLDKMVRGNALIEKFMRKKRKDGYVNVYDRMFGPDGQVMADIFLADRLHMNRKGYEIWQPLIEAKLVR
jgi:lysophospholipase L1-like esterase